MSRPLRAVLPLLLLSLSFAIGGGARAEALFDARSTYAVVAGVLEWKDPGLTPFPKDKRKDQELFETLGKLGVPATQRTLLLDAQATASAFTGAVRSIVARAPAGSTIILYYAGHGVKDNDGKVIFASADIELGHLDKSGLHLSQIPAMLLGFKGRRVLLWADCCYSGGLAEVAAALSRSGLQALALTSAEASNVSTGNWTYSQTLIDALVGRPLLDRDDNGTLTLGELVTEVKEGMRYREGQRSGWVTHGVPVDAVVAAAKKEPANLDRGSGDYERRDWVWVPHDGQREVARVLGSDTHTKEPRLFVELYDYATATQTWVPKKSAEPVTFKTWPAGSELQVTWEKKIYDAKVVRVEDGFMWITYPGWDARWDEWVSGERVVGPKVDPRKTKTAQVEWRGRWYDASVNSEKDGGFCVSYVGYGAEWDECVPKQRIRFR